MAICSSGFYVAKCNVVCSVDYDVTLFYNYLVPINVADGKESKDLCR